MLDRKQIEQTIRKGFNTIDVKDTVDEIKDTIFMYYFNKKGILLQRQDRHINIEELLEVNNSNVITLQSHIAIEVSKGKKIVKVDIMDDDLYWHNLYSAIKKVEGDMHVKISLINKEQKLLKIYYRIPSCF